MPRHLKAVAVVCVLALCGAAVSAAEGIDPAKRADIKKLLELSGSAQMGSQVLTQMVAQFRKSMPQVSDKFWDKFLKQADGNELIELIIPIYDQHFSASEIKDLIKFYETPLGRKFVKEQPAIVAESMKAGSQWGKKLGAKVVAQLQEQKEDDDTK